MRYDPKKIEQKWQKKWLADKTYEPDFTRSKKPSFAKASAGKPFYNLMMFPYPSAEGLHVGNMYAFTGSDIYGRLKRMQGYDVFEPIGLDGFGIHSENYALKTKRHPMTWAKISEKSFYRQLAMTGCGFAWDERLETYDPEYYRWTQWIFVAMFKRGLAYRKKQAVNWCPSCKTVLADEQVVSGACERCGSVVVKKELEQWFFRITNYADRLLKNLEKLDWSERVKIAQKNWIGKSEGALIRFPLIMKADFVLLHGYKGAPNRDFFPWLATELEARGFHVYVPELPHPNEPDIEEQIDFLLKNYTFGENTVIITHSLGGVDAMKLLPRLSTKIQKLIMVAPPLRTEFLDGKKRMALEKATDWKFDFDAIKNKAPHITVIQDVKDDIVPGSHPEEIAKRLNAELRKVIAPAPHFNAPEATDILTEAIPMIEVFTTRPDTLFGATYLVVAPEHEFIENHKSQIINYREVAEYAKKARARAEADRIADGKEKTGVELKGIQVVNPANNEEIPIFVADYVLGGYSTGAIMAVPAHDERDFDFAKKYRLPIQKVIVPEPLQNIVRNAEDIAAGIKAEIRIETDCWIGDGILTNSGKFTGIDSQEAKWEITKFAHGTRVAQYHLRDWLISRQRYWGPPIPMIFCDACAAVRKGEREEMPGWYAVPDKNLPVKLPFIKNFRPTGTDQSPLAAVKKFHKVRCPGCRQWARRETDVSDTFLDSAWYYLRYPSAAQKKRPWDSITTKKWLPVSRYMGGAEHSVLHLLYVRFLAMALRDAKLISFEEPMPVFRSHGLIIKDGAKMSKSKGNTINPDEYIRAYGADALRMYLMFLAPWEQGGDFRDTGIRGMTRFLERVWKLAWSVILKTQSEGSHKILRSAQNDRKRAIHKTIKKVTEDIENLQYNTAISSLMVLLNEFEARPEEVCIDDVNIFLKLLAPFAPHITEELWQQMNGKKKFTSIHREPWPKYDPRLIKEETFDLVVQINGKTRATITLNRGVSEQEATRTARNLDTVKRHLVGEVCRIVFVPDKLINFVV